MREGLGPADLIDSHRLAEAAESSPCLQGYAAELPLDLLANSLRTIRGGQPHGLGGVRRGAQGMRTHVRDCCGLTGRSGGSGRRRAADLTRRGAGEPAADLLCDVKLATAERPCSRDGIAWPGIAWSFRLEQSEHSLGATSRPHRNDPPFGFAERLR